MYGTFFFEDPLKDPAPSLRFKTGTSSFTLTSSPTNEDSNVASALLSNAQTEYVTNGTVNTIKSTTITVRVPPPVYYKNYGGGQKSVITNKFTIKGYQKMSVQLIQKKMSQLKSKRQILDLVKKVVLAQELMVREDQVGLL